MKIKISNHKSVIGAVICLVAFGCVDESVDGVADSDNQVVMEQLSVIAPDVEQWGSPAVGVYEGASDSGETVRIYVNEGVRLYLAKLREELREIEGRVEFPDSESRDLARARAEIIRGELTGHEQVLQQLDVLAPGQEPQTTSLNLPSVCWFIPYGESNFTAHYLGDVLHAGAEATMYPLGAGPQFGPPPPGLPWAYRSVTAKIGDYSTTDSDSTNSKYLSTTAGDLFFWGSDCEMETTHAVSAVCYNYTFESIVVVREQTCAETL